MRDHRSPPEPEFATDRAIVGGDHVRSPSGSVEDVERAIVALAARQRGLVARRQLLALGLGREAVTWRIRHGRLHRLHPGVYSVGHPILPALGVEQAAVLYCGPGGVLSHHSAAVVWGLLPLGQPVHVTLLVRRRGTAGIHLHRTDALRPGDVRIREELRVTAPVRTLVDLAAIDARAFEAALNEALVRRLLPRTDIDAELATRRRGTRRLRAALDAGPPPSRSQIERRLLELIRAAGLPRPQTNVFVGRWEVDALWPGERLIVELDAYATHATPRAFERDRLRDAEHQAAGYRTLRVTAAQLAGRPHAVTASIAVALAPPSASGGSR